jgi:hypothetical protein
MAQRPSLNRPRAKRREHARQRIQTGAELTPDERLQITDLLAQLGRDARDIVDVLATIEYRVVHFWHVLATISDDASPRLNTIARLAAELSQEMAALPHHYLDEAAEADPEWCLPEVPWPVPLRHERVVRFDHHAGSRVNLAQHVAERVETWARDARRRLPIPRGKPVERELRWLLTGLRQIWTERLGRPYRPQSTNRGQIREFVEQIVAIADPHVPAATAISILPPAKRRRRTRRKQQ